MRVNAQFGKVHSDEQEVDLISSRFRFADQVHPATAGKSRFDRKTLPLIEIVRRAFQDVPSGGHGCGGWIQWIQFAGDGIGIQ
jgi:hypothetical protein